MKNNGWKSYRVLKSWKKWTDLNFIKFQNFLRAMPPDPILGRGYGAPPQTPSPRQSGASRLRASLGPFGPSIVPLCVVDILIYFRPCVAQFDLSTIIRLVNLFPNEQWAMSNVKSATFFEQLRLLECPLLPSPLSHSKNKNSTYGLEILDVCIRLLLTVLVVSRDDPNFPISLRKTSFITSVDPSRLLTVDSWHVNS